MRSRLVAIAMLGLAMLAPLAAAVPGLAGLGDARPEQQTPGNEIEQVRDLAQNAAGVKAPAAPVSPIDAPLGGDLSGGYALGALAIMGFGVAAVGFALFSAGARFVTPAEVLENSVRQEIFGYLKLRVGANLKQLTDDLRLTTTNAIWHLRKLEEAGLIHSRRFNGYKVFYPAEGGIEARRLSLGKTALQNSNAQEVFEHVVMHPGTHQREIARALGVNHGTVRWHLKKLMHAELIVETRKGKASSYAPTTVGLAALREVGPKLATVPPTEAPLSTAA